MIEQDMYEKGLEMMAAAHEQAAASQAREANAEPKSDDKEQPKKDEPELMLCPCCNKRTLVRPIEVKGELLDHYMACILSGEPFWREYPIYRGHMLVTVSQINSEDQELMEAGISSLDSLSALLNKAAKVELNKLQYLQNLIKLYGSIQTIKVKSKDGFKAFLPKSHVLSVCEGLKDLALKLVTEEVTPEDAMLEVDKAHKVLTNQQLLSAAPHPLLMSVVESHNYLYNLLLASGFDTNFWEGIELA
jgi:hypothetical protein